MGIRELTTRLASRYEQGEAKAVLRLVLEQAFLLSWTDVLCGAVDTMDEVQKQQLECIMQRLGKGEPVQYVLGEAEFYGRCFSVDSSTLIPRPETEVLVSSVLSTFDETASPSILDIGTGSGCIAITLALELPKANVEAWDISEGAITVANANAEKFSANVLFRQVDVLDDSQTQGIRKYDVIVSNPPYICDKEREDMEDVVLNHEPHTALFVPDAKPLLFYDAITRLAFQRLNIGGMLAFEINRNYGNEVRQLMKTHGFSDVVIVKDQFENNRVVKGILR